MTFAAPHFAWLLFLLPVIALLKIFADSRSQKALNAFVSSDRLRKQLAGGASVEWAGIHFGLQLMALGFFIIAMTRPQLGILEKEVQDTGRNLFIAIDTSKSMLAEDIKPNRINRAKLAALDLLEKTAGDRVGLIAFAGRAFLQAPLTTDHDAVRESIEALDYTTIPRGGSSLSAAIELALDSLEKNRSGQGGMIIFSDGQETDDKALNAAQKAADQNLMLLTVGVGTLDGDVIPDPEQDINNNNTGYIQDKNGNIVHSKLESELLREVAQLTGGEYTELNTQAITQTLIDRLLVRLRAYENSSQQQVQRVERYQWPLLAGILCIMLSLMLRPSSRKRVRALPPPLPIEAQARVHVSRPISSATPAVLALFILVGYCQSASASAVDDLLRRAQKNYEEGHYKEARETYTRLLENKENRLPADELSYGIGAASMQMGEDDVAIKAFSDSLKSHNPKLQQRSLKALGQMLYDKGLKTLPKEPEKTVKSWQDSLTHLGTALQQNASDKETLENYQFVKSELEKLKKAIEELKKQQQQGKGQKPDQSQGQGKGDGEDGQQGEGSKPQENDPDRDFKQLDEMQEEGQQQVPEGQISAGDPGKDAEQQMQQGQEQAELDDQKRNDETGYTPQEARDQLRNYADEQNTFQHLMRNEPPYGGNDY